MSEQVLPFYLVCDESYSMDGAPLAAINQELPKIHRQIARTPIVADKARLGIVGFSTNAEVLLPLADLNDVRTVPQLSPRGVTNYGAAFSLLRDTIALDIEALRQAGHSPFRPTVFFLTDGQPTDDWYADYKRLTDPGFGPHPHILAFGFGEAQPAVLQQVATLRAFIANGDVSPAEALGEFANQFLNSIVQSARASHQNPSDGAQLIVPNDVKGYTVLAMDPV